MLATPVQHGMETNTIGIKSQPDGLDFYYGHRSHGLKMVDFLQNVVRRCRLTSG